MKRRFGMTGDARGRLHASLLVPFLLMSCKDGPGKPDVSGSGQETDFEVLISPERAVDILFMVDNSPSMDPKQEALARAFPKMLESLQMLPGGLPDLHIGVISSDMGAGATEAGGNCSVLLGNEGILWGNDLNADPSKDNNQFATVRKLKNAAGADGCGMNSGTRWIEDLLSADGTRTKNYKGDLSDVFSCLAKGVGVNGCGLEHQLQSVRVALNPANTINPQNFKFLRPKAYLAVVLVSDEDDCSADPNMDTNDGMFFPRNLGDTASLRCAARGHVCNGKAIPDYDPADGYKGSGFAANFADCEAKDVERARNLYNSKDDPSYKELPLIRIRDMIDSVNGVKDRPMEQILATGIIGWPQDLNGVKYEIGKDSTSKPDEEQKLWDYMPICKLPDQQSVDGNIYKAYGGFRLKRFLNGFQQPNETNAFSICHPDNFPDAMASIGTALGKRLAPGCINYALADADPYHDGIQADCTVLQMVSCDEPGEGGCLLSGYQETAIAQCRDGQGDLLDQDNPQTDVVSLEARPCWYLQHDVSELGCTRVPWSLRPMILTRDGGILRPGSLMAMKCATCPDDQPGCLL
jgi:hypothetical protein